MKTFEIALGMLVVAFALFDVFASIILPRPVARRFRVSALVSRNIWYVTRWIGLKQSSARRRDALLGAYAPFALVVFLGIWVSMLILGYGLILDGLRDDITPRPDNLLTSVYFAGTSLLTIGYGDYVAKTPIPRFVAIIAAVSGLAVVAVGTTFLFQIFSSFQRREVFVVSLDGLTGSPPSGTRLLITARELELTEDLPRVFIEGRRWAAEVLDSHLAYAILAYFRSTHIDASWIATLGALLDAATLLVTTIEGVPCGQARLMHEVGTHLSEDLTTYFGIPHSGNVLVEMNEFECACDELKAAGYSVRAVSEAWPAFVEMRRLYAAPLNAMAKFWAIPPAQWIGDRSSLESRH